jgi:hypothetical protein
MKQKLPISERRKAEKKKLRETAKNLDGKVVKLVTLNSSLGDKLNHLGIINTKLGILESAVAYFRPDLFCPCIMQYYSTKNFTIEFKPFSKRLRENEKTRSLSSYSCSGAGFDDLGEVLSISQIRTSPTDWKRNLMETGLDLENGYCESCDKPLAKKLYTLFISRSSLVLL